MPDVPPFLIVSTLVLCLYEAKAYRHHNHLGMHIPLRSVDRAIEVPFQDIQDCTNRNELQDGPAVRNGVKTLVKGRSENVNRHFGCW